MKTALNWLFWIAVVFILVVPSAIGVLLDNMKVASLALVSGGLVLIISIADRVSEISLGPLRAKLKETIAEAHATVEEVRATAIVIARASLGQLIADSFIGRMTSEQRFRLHDEVIHNLDHLGVSDEQINEAKEIWNKGIRVIYVRAIGYAVYGKESPSAPASPTDRQVALGREIKQLRDFRSDWNAASASTLRDLIEERGQMTPLVRKWLDDYQHFEATGEIRDKDQFLRTM